jgi:hybrid cluster-associated redox disulfide protein
MGISKAIGGFVQTTLFGGTLDDLAFEVRVLKGEVQRVHQRLDIELSELRDRIDRLEGKRGRDQGRGRLSVMSGAELADAVAEPELEAAAEVAPTETPTPTPARPDGAFSEAMTILEAHEHHPDAGAVFAQHHLAGCMHCALSRTETVGEGASDHGLDLEALLADLNQLAES